MTKGSIIKLIKETFETERQKQGLITKKYECKEFSKETFENLKLYSIGRESILFELLYQILGKKELIKLGILNEKMEK